MKCFAGESRARYYKLLFYISAGICAEVSARALSGAFVCIARRILFLAKAIAAVRINFPEENTRSWITLRGYSRCRNSAGRTIKFYNSQRKSRLVNGRARARALLEPFVEPFLAATRGDPGGRLLTALATPGQGKKKTGETSVLIGSCEVEILALVSNIVYNGYFSNSRCITVLWIFLWEIVWKTVTENVQTFSQRSDTFRQLDKASDVFREVEISLGSFRHL